jgi:toxin-antitoxin system PIN domain toxin
MRGPALLDVNLLVALFEPDHPHHEVAHDWFADNHANGWATCPLTENGFIRILANPRYGAVISRPVDLVKYLSELCRSTHHVFWADSVSLADDRLFNASMFRGYRQLSDIYLLGLAKSMGGYLATLDRGIPLGSVVGATPATIAVISTATPDE